ncbi:1538_t:CDS:2, partial [Acaulospora colombiana]
MSGKNLPVLPAGLAEMDHPLDRQEHRSFIRQLTSRNVKRKERGEKTFSLIKKLRFGLYFGEQTRLEDFAANKSTFANADVIAICYDRSKPETLHNAIYKSEQRVSTRQGEEAARQIGAVAYIEWTAGIDEPLRVMKELMCLPPRPPRTNKAPCTLISISWNQETGGKQFDPAVDVNTKRRGLFPKKRWSNGYGVKHGLVERDDGRCQSVQFSFVAWRSVILKTFPSQLPVTYSPIFPDGSLKPPPKQEQHHKRYRSIRQRLPPLFSHPQPIQEEYRVEKENKRISSNISFNQYWGNQSHQEDFITSAWAFTHVDVIAICYDRSKPETLHNAIYKVFGYLYPFNDKPVSDKGKQNALTNEDADLVSTQEGEEAARQIGAVAYIEWTRGDQSRLAATETLL